MNLRALATHRERLCNVTLAVAAATYLLLSSIQISTPGPQADEMLHAPSAIALLNGSGDRFGYGISIGKRHFPAMTGEYVGALRSYAILPLFYFFGPSVVTYRLTLILITLIGIYFTARFAKEALGTGAAISGTWLIATDPTFIIATRDDWGPVAIAFTLRMGALYFGWRWWQSKGQNPYPLVIAGFLLGLGVWDKANFIWFVVALVSVAAVGYVLSDDKPRPVRRQFALLVASFLLGAAPLLLYNILRSWITFRLAVLPGETASIAKLIDLVPHRTRLLRSVFDAEATARFLLAMREENVGLAASLSWPMSILAAMTLPLVAIWRKQPWLLFLPALTLVMLVQMYLTPRPIWIHHLIGIYPFPHLCIGAVVALVWESARTPRRRILAIGTTLLVTVAVIFNLMTMARFHRVLASRGGGGNWSDSIYPLATRLEQQFGEKHIQVLDWGIFNPLYLISNGRLKLREPIYSLPRTIEPDISLVSLVAEPQNVFVVRSARWAQMDYLPLALEEAARRAGMRVKTDVQIPDRHGETIFHIVAYTPILPPAPK